MQVIVAFYLPYRPRAIFLFPKVGTVESPYKQSNSLSSCLASFYPETSRLKHIHLTCSKICLIEAKEPTNALASYGMTTSLSFLPFVNSGSDCMYFKAMRY